MDEEESVAWMADPFPDVSVTYSNAHPEIVVVDWEEDEETTDRSDASTLTGVVDEAEVMVRD